MTESSETTAKQLTRVPDKVLLLFLGLVVVIIGWAMSYAIFVQNQKTLLENDQRLQNKLEKIVDGQIQQGLDINSLKINQEQIKEVIRRLTD